MKILLVEDRSYVAESLIHLLESDDVHWIADEHTARRIISVNKEPFDAAILDSDLGLLGGKGEDLIPDLQARNIPCCVYSGLPPMGLEVPTFIKSDPVGLIMWLDGLR